MWVRGLHDERIDGLRRLSDKRWRDEIQRVVDAGAASGAFTVDDSVRTTLRIACLMDGLAVQTVLGGAGLTPDGMATEWLTGAPMSSVSILPTCWSESPR